MKTLPMLFCSWLAAAAFACFLLSSPRAYAQTEPSTPSSQPVAEGANPATEGVGLLRNEPAAFRGYTLLSPLQARTTYLMDMQGRVVKSWNTDRVPASSAYLLENGNLIRQGEQPNLPWRVGPAIGGRVQEFTWDGELVWDYTYFTEKSVPHHDYTKLPNGNVMLIMIERKTADEAIAAGRVPTTVAGGDMSLDALVEIKPTGKTTGEIVWEWHMWDHLVQDWDPTKANFGDVAAHPELVDINIGTGTAGQRAPTAAGDAAGGEAARGEGAAQEPGRGDRGDAGGRGGRGDRGGPGGPGRGRGGRGSSDWTHTNAVAYNADFDQLMLSIHNHSEVWIIDHSTTTAEAAGHTGGRSGKGGDLLYRWGNPITYRAGTADDQRLFVQHNTHWIPKGLPGAGNMLVFNNGRRGAGGSYSSVDEVVLPVDAQGRYTREAGQKFGPAEAVWSYVAPNPPDFYSSFISGASRLPNGNTIICSGANGFMFEVTPDKKVVWQYNNPPHTPPAQAAAQPAQPAGERGGQGDRGDRGAADRGGGDRGAGANSDSFPSGRGGGGGRRGGGGPNPRSLFRAYRYGPEFPGLVGKELTPGKTLEEHAAPPRAEGN
jgi:hypothetical protein